MSKHIEKLRNERYALRHKALEAINYFLRPKAPTEGVFVIDVDSAGFTLNFEGEGFKLSDPHDYEQLKIALDAIAYSFGDRVKRKIIIPTWGEAHFG